MHTLLFDIDGTLIRSGGAGFRAMQIALAQIAGIETIPSVDLHGRTDRGILGELFELVDLDYDYHSPEFNRVYWENLPVSLQQSQGSVLPGVVELLTKLSSKSNFALGVLTGNARRAAEIKLDHFQLSSFFAFGGHGDHHASRNDVASLARQAAEVHLADRFDENKVWVIGDTVNDIVCARSIGARVIAVETGGADPQELKSAKPDAQFATLDDSESFLNLFDKVEA